MCTCMHTEADTHPYSAHIRSMHSQSRGNELMESQHTTLGAKENSTCGGAKKREKQEREGMSLVWQKAQEKSENGETRCDK